jgi:small subunit ribosomal protein S18
VKPFRGQTSGIQVGERQKSDMERAASEDANDVIQDIEPEEEDGQAEREERGDRRRSDAPVRAERQQDERPSPRGRDRDGGRRERRFRRPKRRVCAFCVDKVTHIDYKDYQRLREFVSDRGKILKSRMTGTCSRHQRKLARAVKRARHIALLPFVTE